MGKSEQVCNESTEMIRTIIDEHSILEKLRSINVLENNSSDYHNAVTNMCNYFTMIIGESLKSFVDTNSLLVKEGVYGMIGNHTWLELEDFIIDATVQQFDINQPTLSTPHSSSEMYQDVRSYKFKDWMELQND